MPAISAVYAPKASEATPGRSPKVATTRVAGDAPRSESASVSVRDSVSISEDARRLLAAEDAREARLETAQEFSDAAPEGRAADGGHRPNNDDGASPVEQARERIAVDARTEARQIVEQPTLRPVVPPEDSLVETAFQESLPKADPPVPKGTNREEE